MRISDWSSDVCSSDLVAGRLNVSRQPVTHALAVLKAQGFLEASGRQGLTVAPIDPALLDRKSVVEGKSVSVRVDLGGRRIIKKKHIIHKHQYTNTKSQTLIYSSTRSNP